MSSSAWDAKVQSLPAPNPFAQKHDPRLLQRIRDYDRGRAKIVLAASLGSAILCLWINNTYLWIVMWYYPKWMQVVVSYTMNALGLYFFVLSYQAAKELLFPPRISVTESERALLGLPYSECVDILPVIPPDTTQATLSEPSTNPLRTPSFQSSHLYSSQSMMDVSSTDAQGIRYRGKLSSSSSQGRVLDNAYMNSPNQLRQLWDTPTPVKGGYRSFHDQVGSLPPSRSESSISGTSRLFTSSLASRFKYQAARNPVVSTAEESDELSVNYANAAMAGYAKMKLGESIYESRERIREWVTQVVIVGTIFELERSVERYKPPVNMKPESQPQGSSGFALGTTKKSGFSSPSSWGSKSSSSSSSSSFGSFGSFGGTFGGGKGLTSERELEQKRLEDLHRAYELKKFQLEEYSKVTGFASSKDYVMHRIKTLGSTRGMTHFKWNSGGSWESKEWTPDLPSDAELVMHLFCTFLNHQLQVLPSVMSETPFSSRYFIVYPKKPDSNKVGAVLFQRHKGAKPHFEVYKKGELIRIMPV